MSFSLTSSHPVSAGSVPSEPKHIDAHLVQEAVYRHQWLGCDIVLTEMGFHQIHDQLSRTAWNPLRAGVPASRIKPSAGQGCVQTPVV